MKSATPLVTRGVVVCCALSALIGPWSATAQVGASPWLAPSTEREDKYFLFSQSGLSLAQAETDLAECLAYARPHEAFAVLPPTIVIGSNVATGGGSAGTSANGIAQALLVAEISRGFANRVSRGNMRRCMQYKGYSRYAVTKESWTAFNAGTDAVHRQAQLAIGPTPTVTRLRS